VFLALQLLPRVMGGKPPREAPQALDERDAS
jgi:hypothetical protein